MNLQNVAKTAAALAVIGGYAITMDTRYVKAGEFAKHLASERVQTILDLAARSAEADGPMYLCNTIREEFAELCTELPEHAMCAEDARPEILKMARC